MSAAQQGKDDKLPSLLEASPQTFARREARVIRRVGTGRRMSHLRSYTDETMAACRREHPAKRSAAVSLEIVAPAINGQTNLTVSSLA